MVCFTQKLNPLHDPINLLDTLTLWLISGLDYQSVKSIISPSDSARCTTFFMVHLALLIKMASKQQANEESRDLSSHMQVFSNALEPPECPP